MHGEHVIVYERDRTHPRNPALHTEHTVAPALARVRTSCTYRLNNVQLFPDPLPRAGDRPFTSAAEEGSGHGHETKFADDLLRTRSAYPFRTQTVVILQRN